MRHAIEDVESLVTKLAIAYAHRMSDTERAAAVMVWRDAFDGVPWPEIEQAADAFIREPGRYMPKPGEVRSRALELARKRFQPDLGREHVTWHTDYWSEGRCPETGRPTLCLCGNEEWFTRAESGAWHGHVKHRARCTHQKRAAA
jgi:hypothetical protein